MRNVSLVCIALLIAVGVLAKNPPASAPSLAASLASIPVAPVPQPAPLPEPIKTRSEPEQFLVETATAPADAIDDFSHRSVIAADAEPQIRPVDFLMPAVGILPVAEKSSQLSEQVVSLPENDVPLSGLSNHAFSRGLAKTSDELSLSFTTTRSFYDETPSVDAHSFAIEKFSEKNDLFKPLVSNSTISDVYSRRLLTRFYERIESGTTISNSIVRKAELVHTPTQARTLPERVHQISFSRENVGTGLSSRPVGVLDILSRSEPVIAENAGFLAEPILRRTAKITLASETSISNKEHLNYRRSSSLSDVIASSIAEVVEQPILPPPTLAKPRTIERLAPITTSASLSSAIMARKMFKDTLSPMLAKSVPMDKSIIDSEPSVLNVAAPVAMMPPMFSEAEAKRARAAVMPVAPSKFSINLAPDPGSVIMNSLTDVKPVSVNDASVRNANASPARFQLNIQDGGYCDTKFVGPTITFAQTAELTLDDLLYQIHNRFGVNFLMGPDLGKLPINIKSGSIPWNTLLRSQLFVSGVRATCLGQNTIQLIKNESLPKLQSGEAVKTTFLKLRYLQPTTGGNVDVAGQRSSRGGGQGDCGGSGGGLGGGGLSSGGGQQSCGNFEKLIIEIEKILGIRSMSQSSIGGGGNGSQGGDRQTEELRTNRSVTVIPGRNILLVRANDEELELIEEIIKRADRPPFQVVIKGLIYTANQDKLKDIGVQTTITEQSGRTTGGIFGHTLGSAGTLFDFSTIVGTFDFNVQATALQQDGVISIKSRPFATVLDGETTDLTVGRQVPVLIQAINPTGGIPGSLQILQAANLLSVTPHVIDDDNGNPIGVNLELQLDSNEVDTSVISQGIPSVSVRSIQTRLMLNPDQTAILGGFTLDSDSRTVSKTPGLGDIPIIGELFKRRVKQSQVNRLYFAISVTIVPFPGEIRPVDVPGATPQPPSITPEMKLRGDKGEPKQVTGP